MDENEKKLFSNISPIEWTVLSNTIGYLLIDDLDADQLNTLSEFFDLISQVLATVGDQKELLENIQTEKKRKKMEQDIKKLQEKVEQLENSLNDHLYGVNGKQSSSSSLSSKPK